MDAAALTVASLRSLAGRARRAARSRPRVAVLAALLVVYAAYRRARRRRRPVRDRVVLITGGASGLGRELAGLFARAGAVVVLWDVDAATLDAAGRELAAGGARVRTGVVDVSDAGAVRAAAGRLLRDLDGRTVEVLVNNAGVLTAGGVEELSDEEIERAFRVNALAHFWTVRAFLPGMAASPGGGHVVTVASAAALGGVAGVSHYSASKFAAFGFDESLRAELHRRGLGARVRTTCVCPFLIDTGMLPQGVPARSPALLPVMSAAHVATRVFDAVACGDAVLVLPPLLNAVPLMRALLPVAVMDWFLRVAGAQGIMSMSS